MEQAVQQGRHGTQTGITIRKPGKYMLDTKRHSKPRRSHYLDTAIVAVMFQRKRASYWLGMTTTV